MFDVGLLLYAKMDKKRFCGNVKQNEKFLVEFFDASWDGPQLSF